MASIRSARKAYKLMVHVDQKRLCDAEYYMFDLKSGVAGLGLRFGM